MKRLIMIALLCAPLMVFAQGREGGATKPTNGTSSAIDYTKNRLIYAEVVMTTGQGVSSARIEFGDEMKQIITNKEDVVKLEAIKARRYGSAVDALNALNSEGFKVSTSFTVQTRQGTEAHIILEKANLPGNAAKSTKATKGPKK